MSSRTRHPHSACQEKEKQHREGVCISGLVEIVYFYHFKYYAVYLGINIFEVYESIFMFMSYEVYESILLNVDSFIAHSHSISKATF